VNARYFVLALAVSSLCWANEKPQCKTPKPTPQPTDPSSIGINVSDSSSSSSSSKSSASSTSSANQHQSQTQSQTANGGNANAEGGNASNGGNSITNETSIPRQAPPAYAPTIVPSNCQGSLTGGASSPVGGISIGGSRADKNCQFMAVASAFAALRNFKAAARVLCETKAAKAAKLSLDDCLLMEAQIEATAKVEEKPAPAPVVIHDEPLLIPPQVIVVEPPVQEAKVDPPKAEEVKQKPIAASTKKPVHHAKPCAVPDSLKQPLR